MPDAACAHDWVEDFDAAADAAAYNDGFNYSPAEYICTKCGRKRQIEGRNAAAWQQILLAPVLLAAMLFLGAISSIVIVVVSVYTELFTNKKG